MKDWTNLLERNRWKAVSVDIGPPQDMSRAGFPAYVPDSVMSLVTTLPAPITTSSQMLTGMMVALVPMLTRLPMVVSFHWV